MAFETSPFATFQVGTSSPNRFSGAFPDPYLDYASTQTPRSIYDVLRWCFPKGTLVYLPNGQLRAIEDVLPGDTVLNRFGVPAKVKTISRRPYVGKMVTVTIKDASSVPITATANHEFFCVQTPRLKPGRVKYALRADKIVKCRIDALRLGDYLTAPQPKLGEVVPPSMDPYVAGLYVGDGYPCRRSVRKVRDADNQDFDYATRWSMGPAKAGAVAELKAKLQSVGLTVCEFEPENIDAVWYTVHDKGLIDSLKQNFGHGAHGKFIGEAAYGWSRQQVLEFVSGYVDTDGHLIKKNELVAGVGITSCNLELLLQVQRLCHAAGVTPTLSGQMRRAVVPNGTEYNSMKYMLYFNGHEMDELLPYCTKLRGVSLLPKTRGRTASVLIKDGVIFRRIVRLEESTRQEDVYNFEVEGEHSYLVSPYVATSNCEFLWVSYGTYRMAMQRVVRYFLTSVELIGISDDEKQKYEDFLSKELRIMDVLAESGDNFIAYGQDFLSVLAPFRRYLRCPKCRLERPLQKAEYTWTNWQFHLKCQNCDYQGAHQRVDRKSLKQDKMRVVHWSPHEIRILFHPVSGKVLYYWEIPAIFKREIERGNTFYLETTPWELIEACKMNRLFRFEDDVIYHLKENAIAGLRTFGWGIPRIFSNFKQAWYVQILKRYNEAIALDYIIPFRILTPAPGTSREADPLLHMNLQTFQSRVLSMFKQHRRDPTTIHALPFAAKMEMLGAGGAELSPVELLNNGTDELLNAQGVPAELYRGTLQIQALPVALRLFERTWGHMINGMNGMLNWLLERCSKLHSWEVVEARLQPVTLADDIEKKQIQLQLAAGQQISRQTAWAPFGINYREEIKKLFEEEEYSREQMARFQEEQSHKDQLQQTMVMGATGQAQPGMPGAQPGMSPEQAAQASAAQQGTPPTPQALAAGAAAGGGMGMAANAGQVTPEDLSAQAEQIAMQMLGMPYEQRRSELLKIKKANETLHSLVIAKMDKIRQDASSQGGFQALQQMVGAGANM